MSWEGRLMFKKGDLISPKWKIEDCRKKFRVRILMMEGGDFNPEYPHYQAPRYYSLSVNPDDYDPDYMESMVTEITKFELGYYLGDWQRPEDKSSFAVGNERLEELWLKLGGK
jgi:hypothetical protein